MLYDRPVATDDEVRGMLGKIQFLNPEPAKRGPVKVNPFKQFWADVRRILVENPGKWALVMPDTSLSTANKIKQGRNPQIDPEFFEVTIRTIKDHPKKHVTLYLRYIGENGEFAEDWED